MGSAANDFSNDARTLRDQASASAGKVGEEVRTAANRTAAEAKAGAERVSDDAREELAKLRAQVERLMSERVTPALAGAADQVQDYASRAREMVEDQADALSETVRERPLVAVVVAAVGGYLLGRLMGGHTYVYHNDR
ncbi:MAG: hypothetical protein K2X49_16810 [Acetobacteraceae bacterium]|nr:hypothetical protein [Acetobacteraceae bacterium]